MAPVGRPSSRNSGSSSNNSRPSSPSALPFKNPLYKPARPPIRRKTLKQIVQAERYPLYPADVASYTSIEAPPPVVPKKHYCDVTGLLAHYHDPKTGLWYHSVEVYQFIQSLPQSSVHVYLTGRNTPVVTSK